MEPFVKFVKTQTTPNTFVHSLCLGANWQIDEEDGWAMSADNQVSLACAKLAAIPEIQHTPFNFLTLSQGGQFARAVVQRCSSPALRVHNLITLGGQHQGVFGMPRCAILDSAICNTIRKLLNFGAYLGFIQNFLAPANYWHDPLQEALYAKDCHFLPDINNVNSINQTYVKNLQSLNKFVMVKFENDTVVVPRASEWFGFYTPGQAKTTQSLQNSKVYTRLGLDKMDKANKLVFLQTPGDHLQFTLPWFTKNVTPYLQ